MPIARVFVEGSSLKQTEILFTSVDEVEIKHSYQRRPMVLVCDINGNIIGGDIKHTSDNTILVSFSHSISGKIYLR
jgi:hypothetical protein